MLGKIFKNYGKSLFKFSSYSHPEIFSGCDRRRSPRSGAGEPCAGATPSLPPPIELLAPGSRDMFNTNNKAVDYLFRALCEFDRVHTEHLACRIWSVLKEAHVGNAHVQARMYATYRKEYENFTHLPGESIDALFQRFTEV
jgi:hypothetical protein